MKRLGVRDKERGKESVEAERAGNKKRKARRK